MITAEVLQPVSSTTSFVSAPPVSAPPMVQPRRFPEPRDNSSNRWGVILAGGDGVRPCDRMGWTWGDNRPEQFCTRLGNQTLLEETRKRAERSIPPKQILFPVTRAHEQYYLRYLASRASQRIVQPCDKGTAPAILFALMRIAKFDPGAIVAIFPCERCSSPESVFTAALESAFMIAEWQTGSVVLLGAEPRNPELEHSWIEVGQPIHGCAGLFKVKGFQEKPPLALAQDLFKTGSLGNTFVMVGPVKTFLDFARRTVPALLQVFESESGARGPGGEIRIADAVYKRFDTTDFSRQILAAATDRLLALRLNELQRSDLVDPRRKLATFAGREREFHRASVSAA